MSDVLLALAVTFIAQAAVTVALYSAPVVSPAAVADFGVSPAAIGYFIATAYIGSMMGSVFGGAVVARLGPIRVSQISLAICFAGASLAAAAPLAGGAGAIVLVMAAALLIGLGYGPAVPASAALLQRNAPPGYMTLIFAVKQTGVPAGAALAGVLAPALILWLGWRWCALLIGLGCAAMALAGEPFRRRFDVDLKAGAPLSIARVFAPVGLVWREKRLLELAATAFLYGGVQMALVTYLVTFVIDTFAASLVLAGLVLSVSQVASVVGRISWAALADRVRNRPAVLGVLGVAMGLLACATALASPAWPGWLLFAFAAAFGATAVGWNGVYLAEVAHRAPPGRTGEASGGCMFFGFFGAVASPLVFHAIFTLSGTYWAAYAFAGALALLAGLRLLLVQSGR